MCSKRQELAKTILISNLTIRPFPIWAEYTFISPRAFKAEIQMPGVTFDELAKSMTDEILSWDPSFATQLGLHKYDGMMMDPSKESISAQAKRLREFVEMLEELRTSDLSLEEVLDRDLAIQMFKIRIFELEELKMHELMSEVAEEIGDSLFFLFARDYLPFELRIEMIASRLEKVPQFIARSKETLTSPYKLWNEVAYETGERLPAFLKEIEMAAEANLGDSVLTRRLKNAARSATEEIALYNQWLREDVLPRSKSKTSISFDDYAEYMALKGFGITPDEAVEVAERHLELARKARTQIAEKISPSGSVEEAVNVMMFKHPETFEGVLKAYRNAILECRNFVTSKKLVTFPEGEKLLVIETPNFMRHVAPFAAQFEPGKYTSDRTGLFLVTPKEGDPDALRDHSYAAIANTAVHEAYPGHHLQGICGNIHPSHVRVLSPATDFIEGWGFYCEELMMSLGFNNTNEGRLAQTLDLIFRIVRVIADVKLIKGEMTVDDVADMLVRETGMTRQAALNDAMTYSFSPTYYLSYFIGKLKLMQLRDDIERVMGQKFSLRFFHDSLLYSGTMPVDYMRRALAIKLKESYGIELGPPRESLYEFGLRSVQERKS